MFTFCILGSCTYVASKHESLSRGHLEISFQLEIHADMQTPDNFCRPVSFLSPLCFYSLFLLPALPPSVSGIVHVFTSKVIVPDLYDRPLTLRVLVHQHQAENTQGHVWAGPNLAVCHSIAVTSNWNALQQITFIPALLKHESVEQGEKCCGL